MSKYVSWVPMAGRAVPPFGTRLATNPPNLTVRTFLFFLENTLAYLVGGEIMGGLYVAGIFSLEIVLLIFGFGILYTPLEWYLIKRSHSRRLGWDYVSQGESTEFYWAMFHAWSFMAFGILWS